MLTAFQLWSRRSWRALFRILLFAVLVPLGVVAAESVVLPLSNTNGANARTFSARGVVQEVESNGWILVIKHDAIPGYMDAMTMPFKVKDPAAGQGLQRGDEISFRLHVTEDESWADNFKKTGSQPLPGVSTPEVAPPVRASRPLLDYKFTNELERAVSLNDFHGQALAITFFYTRCPLPDYCPRLSKNFQEASQKLAAMPGAPTNWHFLSISFDPETDTPSLLKAYGEMYHYNPAHWSFLTGPPDKIGELAALSGVTFQRDGVLLNHNLRTLIVDANHHLQTVFPMGGDLSDAIVAEIFKAAAVTNGFTGNNADSGGSPSAKPASNSLANPVAP